LEFREYSTFGTGIVVSRIIEAILLDQNRIFAVSSIVFGPNHIEGVALSLPSIINADGIRQVVELNLSASETEKLQKSAQRLKSVIMELEQPQIKTETPLTQI